MPGLGTVCRGLGRTGAQRVRQRPQCEQSTSKPRMEQLKPRGRGLGTHTLLTLALSTSHQLQRSWKRPVHNTPHGGEGEGWLRVGDSIPDSEGSRAKSESLPLCTGFDRNVESEIGGQPGPSTEPARDKHVGGGRKPQWPDRDRPGPPTGHTEGLLCHLLPRPLCFSITTKSVSRYRGQEHCLHPKLQSTKRFIKWYNAWNEKRRYAPPPPTLLPTRSRS